MIFPFNLSRLSFPNVNAVLMKTNACIKDALSKSDKKTIEGNNRLNELYIRKLIKVVHFLAANNLPVKELYPKLVSFLANDIKEPVVKQYLDACKKSEVNIDKIKIIRLSERGIDISRT